jgi:hypothetical protein
MGVNTIKYEIMPFRRHPRNDLSASIVAANIHVTPDRLKVVASPDRPQVVWAGHYRREGQPLGIKSLEDLRARKLARSPARRRTNTPGTSAPRSVPDGRRGVSSIVQNRVKVVLEDNVLFYNFIKADPTAGIEIV